MKMPFEIPAVAEMKRYAADFFSARKQLPKNRGK